jgi:hypothetical protein
LLETGNESGYASIQPNLSGDYMDESKFPVTSRLRRRRRKSFSFSLLTIFFLVACVAVALFFVLRFRSPGGLGFAEQREIRTFLKENLDSGEWDEVRWYLPAKNGSSKLIRVKIRSKNRFGASELFDLVFSFDGQGFRSWGNDSSMFYYFWDASGQPQHNAENPANRLARDIASGKYLDHKK